MDTEAQINVLGSQLCSFTTSTSNLLPIAIKTKRQYHHSYTHIKTIVVWYFDLPQVVSMAKWLEIVVPTPIHATLYKCYLWLYLSNNCTNHTSDKYN